MSDAPGTFKENIVQPWTVVSTPVGKREILRRPKAVRERHRMVMYLHCAGWKGVEIAKAMGYKP